MKISAKSCLLVISYDFDVYSILADYLKSDGFEVISVRKRRDGLQQALAGVMKFDLVVLDMILPSMDGFEALQRFRSLSDTPVLMLADSQDALYGILALEMGADDYMAKPITPRELVARVRAILRRTKERCTKELTLPESERLVVGDIELDTGNRDVRLKGERIKLTSVEFNLLEILLKAAGHVVRREQLAEMVPGRAVTAHSLGVHLRRLRKKLVRKSGRPERIKTIRGVGYIYTQPFQYAENE